MTAGRNALRGSGPSQKFAFDDALADFGRPSCQQRCEPGPMPGATELGITNDGKRAGHEKAAQMPVPLFADTAEPFPKPLECCLGTSPIQAEKLRPERKALGSATLATSAVASSGPTPGMQLRRLLIWLERCHTMIIRSKSKICFLRLSNWLPSAASLGAGEVGGAGRAQRARG